MVETITPAGCGTRHRTALAARPVRRRRDRRVAALGGAAAGRPARLGGARAASRPRCRAPRRRLRESGARPLPLPQSRRQVPERWRHELPLPVWSLRLRRRASGSASSPTSRSPRFLVRGGRRGRSGPTAAVLALTAFGIGRVVGASLPSASVDRMAAALPADAPRSTPSRWPRSRWPSWSRRAGGGHARTRPGQPARPRRRPRRHARLHAARRQRRDRRSASCRRPARRSRFAGASEPSLRGEYLAYRDAAGVNVVRWRTGAPGRRASPAPGRSRPSAGRSWSPSSSAERASGSISTDLRTGKRRSST